MAEATGVGAPYLRKVVDRLRRSGVVRTQRGVGGGVLLAIAPSELTLLDVVDAVDPLQRIARCPLGLPDHVRLCPLHSELDAAITQVQAILASRTIAELIHRDRRRERTCKFPRNYL